jgi:hypothetical protein
MTSWTCKITSPYYIINVGCCDCARADSGWLTGNIVLNLDSHLCEWRKFLRIHWLDNGDVSDHVIDQSFVQWCLIKNWYPSERAASITVSRIVSCFFGWRCVSELTAGHCEDTPEYIYRKRPLYRIVSPSNCPEFQTGFPNLVKAAWTNMSKYDASSPTHHDCRPMSQSRTRWAILHAIVTEMWL